jgi:hypothetical protein
MTTTMKTMKRRRIRAVTITATMETTGTAMVNAWRASAAG